MPEREALEAQVLPKPASAARVEERDIVGMKGKEGCCQGVNGLIETEEVGVGVEEYGWLKKEKEETVERTVVGVEGTAFAGKEKASEEKEEEEAMVEASS